MEHIERLATQIQAQFETATDSAYRERIRELVPTAGAIAGVPVPRIRELAAGFFKEHAGLTLDTACRLQTWFGEHRSREGLLFGTFLLTKFRRQFTREFWLRIDPWVDMLDNWETCDQLATNVAAEVVVKHLDLVEDLVRWTEAANPWRRRFAAAVTTALNQHGRSHPLEALRVCENLMREREAIVQKAVGWAIREASKRDATATFAFLSRWKGEAQPKILREGSEKLPDAYQTALRG